MKKVKKAGGRKQDVSAEDLLKDLLITQLAVAGVPQQTIRDIVGCDIVRVSRIAKHMKKKKEGRMSNNGGDLVLKRLERLVEIVENLFVLEAAKAGVSQQEIRKMVGISINRVNNIAKHVKVTKLK